MAARSCATPDAAPWNTRLHPVRPSDDVRSAFAIDRDRVIHCDTFRDLQHKTQVQSIIETAGPRTGFFRTRLNHVIEVAQIARGLAAEVGANSDLAEAISLAHDLGHPPFGHAGERGLAAALAENGVRDWNANTHSLTVVDRIEAAFVDFRGLNLTWATREGIARHTTPFDVPSSAGEFAASPNAGLESQLVDAADVMAYLSHDLDDALAGGYIEIGDLAAISPLLEELASVPAARWRAASWPPEDRARIVRRRLVARLIGRLIGDLTQQTIERITRFGSAGPQDVRTSVQRVVAFSATFEGITRDLLDVLTAQYYRSARVRDSDANAVAIVTGLFDALMNDSAPIPSRFREDSDALRVATYVASLNDLSATRLAHRLDVKIPAQATAPS